MWATGNSRKPVVSSEVGEMWTIWNSWIHTKARTHAHTHSPCPFFFSSKTGVMWEIWNVVRRYTIKQNGGKVGNWKYLTHTHTHIYTTRLSKKTSCVSFLGNLQFPRIHMFKADGWNAGKVKFTHARTHAHEERGDVGNSKCSNKNKHTRRHTYMQEDRENVDSTNARVHIFWLLVDCWQCGDLLKTGSRSRTDVLHKFLETNFTE